MPFLLAFSLLVSGSTAIAGELGHHWPPADAGSAIEIHEHGEAGHRAMNLAEAHHCAQVHLVGALTRHADVAGTRSRTSTWFNFAAPRTPSSSRPDKPPIG